MKIFSAQKIKEWDAYTIAHEPVSSHNLMERAATACVQWLTTNLLPEESSVVIFCGKGNNGGDGLAIARMLIQELFDVKVFVLADREGKGSADFEHNLLLLPQGKSSVHLLMNHHALPPLSKTDFVIDALFGTGLNKPLAGLAMSVVEAINASDATVVSIDIPSGMFADQSSNGYSKVKATHTLSFQQYKTAFLLPENEPYTGAVSILDIGLHPGFYQQEKTPLHLTGIVDIKRLYKPPAKFSHKGNNGHALLVAGSYGKMGAAVLAAKACLRAGVGLLTSQVPETGYQVIQTSVPEAMATTDSTVAFEKYQAIGAGPGCGTAEDAVLHISNIIANCAPSCKLILDADALNVMATHSHLLDILPVATIITPHPKEFERLFGKTSNDFERLQLALQKAAVLKCYIVLKGHYTFIATPEGAGYFNSTGNPGMATGGSGDALTGILTGLAARGYNPLHTCLLGVFLHGLAGDIAAGKLSQEAMLPSDLIENIGAAYLTIANAGF